jgi:hypothetical protein
METCLKWLLGLLGILLLFADVWFWLNLKEQNRKRGLNYYQKLIRLFFKTLRRKFNQIVRPIIYQKYSEGYFLPAKFIYTLKLYSKTQF